MPRFPSLHAVLFDLDGTLLDSAPDLGMAVNVMRERRRLPALALHRYRPGVGSGAKGLLHIGFDITPRHPHFPSMREEFFNIYEQNMTRHTRPFAGIPTVLEQILAEGLLWGVVTNKMERFSLPLLQSLPLFRTAATLISGDTTAHSKPHPEPLLEATRRLGVRPQHCMYVGDDARDMQAGRAAGMITVAARYGYLSPGEDCSQWDADASVDRPVELLSLMR